MSGNWSKGSTRAWRGVRARVLARDGYACRLQLDRETCPRHHRRCEVPCATYARHAHHTRGRAVTGDDERYIVAACQPCNLHVGEPAKASDPKGRAKTTW